MLSQGYKILEYWQHKYVVLWWSGQATCVRMFLKKPRYHQILKKQSKQMTFLYGTCLLYIILTI